MDRYADGSPLNPPEAATPNPNTQAVDASTSPIHDAWSKWTSSPANNAALLQFGIAMLQPHGTGQSQIGAAANAIGEAGQAEGRYTQTQGEEESRQAQIEDKESQAAARGVHGQAEMINARAYEQGVRNHAAANPDAKSGTAALLRAQAGFTDWLNGKNQIPGLEDDITKALRQMHPEIKSRADILINPQYQREAFEIYKRAAVAGGLGGEAAPPPVPGAAPVQATPPSPAVAPPSAPSTGVPQERTKIFYDAQGRGVLHVLRNGQWIIPNRQ